jgi:integrase
MTRTHNRLTAAQLLHLPAGLHLDGQGLHLRVVGASRSWVFRYRYRSRRRHMGIGTLELVSLAQARQLATAARQQLLAGRDPIEARAAERSAQRLAQAKAVTLADVVAQFLDAHASRWRGARTRTDFERSIATHAPQLMPLPVAEINTALVVAALRPIWQAKPNLAGKLRQRLEVLFDFARVSEYRTGDNPARWRGHLDHVLAKKPKPKAHTALPYVEIPAFVAQLRQHDSIPCRALELAILTACRTSEATGAQWSEIDLTARTWVIPASRTKPGRQHRVALSSAAVRLLATLPQVGPHVFVSRVAGQHLSDGGLRFALALLGRPDLTPHGFRASFRTWAAERTSFARELAEAALGHALGDETELAYQRSDLLEKRQPLMQAWADFATGVPSGVVVRLTA